VRGLLLLRELVEEVDGVLDVARHVRPRQPHRALHNTALSPTHPDELLFGFKEFSNWYRLMKCTVVCVYENIFNL
jgi:hypothetical protein